VFHRFPDFAGLFRASWGEGVAGASLVGRSILRGRDLTSPELAYPVVQELQQYRWAFTAIVAFNDKAIGAIRTLRDANLRRPRGCFRHRL
jgi:DNA-binding LacI/PurR family transcriptional regulator